MGRKKQRPAAPLDPVRKRLLRLLTAKGSNLRTASIAMGRNDAYLQQFIYRGTPKVLAEDDREILAEHLGCRPELLKHGRSYRISTNATRPSPPDDAYAAPIGYSAVPEADLREEPDAEETWNGELRETGDTWMFADAFIRHRLRADPGDLWMVEVDGDSMEPLLSSGDHIMIDVSPDGARAAGDLRDLGRHRRSSPRGSSTCSTPTRRRSCSSRSTPSTTATSVPPKRSASLDGRSGLPGRCERRWDSGPVPVPSGQVFGDAMKRAGHIDIVGDGGPVGTRGCHINGNLPSGRGSGEHLWGDG